MIEEVTIIALLLFILIQEYFNRKERKQLIQAIIAKNLPELKEAEKELPIAKEPAIQPDYVPIESVSDEVFVKAIKKEMGREGVMEQAKEELKKRLRRKRGR